MSSQESLSHSKKTSSNESSLRFSNVEEVKNAIFQLAPESSSLKESLLRCYILNLILYRQLTPEQSHLLGQVKKTLVSLSVHIDLLDKAKTPEDKKGSNILREEPLEEKEPEKRRPINYVIEKNKVHTEKQPKKKEEGNPKTKNRRRFEDAKELSKRVRENYPNIQNKRMQE